MKPSQTLASAQTPSSETLECIKHDQDIYLYLNRQPVCSTRAFEPEVALARAGCSRIHNYRAPKMLLAGLGLGHCLHEVLTLAPAKASIHVAERMKALIEWHRHLLGETARNALLDSRLTIHTVSTAAILHHLKLRFDAIMLSTDPSMTTASRNTLRVCAANLNPKGIICIKSSREDSAQIKGVLESCRLRTTIKPVGARPRSRTRAHAIICAAQRTEFLPATD